MLVVRIAGGVGSEDPVSPGSQTLALGVSFALGQHFGLYGHRTVPAAVIQHIVNGACYAPGLC